LIRGLSIGGQPVKTAVFPCSDFDAPDAPWRQKQHFHQQPEKPPMSRILRGIVWGLCLCLAREHVAPAAEPEGRGIWWHFQEVKSDPAAGKAQIEAFVRRCALAHLNLILPWATSDYLAALTNPEYQKRFPAAKWDSLGYVIETAARAGIQVHLWYSFTYYKNRGSPEFNPAAGGNPEWAAVRDDEFVPGKDGKVQPRRWADVCNLHDGARAYTLDLLQETLKRYPKMSGIHIEEPGFGYQGNCVCPLCQEIYRRIYAAEIVGNTQLSQAVDLKCLATTDFMRRLREMMLETDKSLILSTNGGYSSLWDRGLGRDWGVWAKRGWLDYYAVQIYVPDSATLGKRSAMIVADIGRDTPVYGGVRLRVKQKQDRDLTPDELCNFVNTVRSAGAKGVVLFWGDAFSDAQATALRQGPFQEPVPLPAAPRTTKPDVPQPKGR